MIRALTRRNRAGLTPEILRAMTRLPPPTPDLPAVMESATATSSAMQIGDGTGATLLPAPAWMSVSTRVRKRRRHQLLRQ